MWKEKVFQLTTIEGEQKIDGNNRQKMILFLEIKSSIYRVMN
jgi:hypothetical protein